MKIVVGQKFFSLVSNLVQIISSVHLSRQVAASVERLMKGGSNGIAIAYFHGKTASMPHHLKVARFIYFMVILIFNIGGVCTIG